MAFGCQTTIIGCPWSPAPSKNAFQSSPGARLPNAVRFQGL